MLDLDNHAQFDSVFDTLRLFERKDELQGA